MAKREDDEEAVIAANQSFYDAFESLDPHRMARVWSESSPVTCIHPSSVPGQLLEGREAVMSSWRSILRATSAIRFVLRDVRAFVAGDVGWVVLVEQMESRHGTDRIDAAAEATNVFAREVNGWKLVHHHAAPVRLASPRKEEPAEPKKRSLN